jgi:hypothetical protein
MRRCGTIGCPGVGFGGAGGTAGLVAAGAAGSDVAAGVTGAFGGVTTTAGG